MPEAYWAAASADVLGGAPVGLGDHLRIGVAQQLGQPLHHLGLAFEALAGRHAVVVALDVGDLHHQHGVVRGHGAATFREDVRMRQFLLVAEFLEHADYGTGVVVHVVVDRAGIARMGAVVVHAQTATDVDVIQWQAQGAQLGIVADGFAEALAIVGQVGDLRTHVEVQQAHALLQAGGAEALDHRQQLGSGETELGLLATGVGPFARRQGRQPHPQANLGRDLELGRLLDHQRDLGLLLDDDEDTVAQFLAHQRQANEFAVLVAVADDGAALGRQRQHRHQLRLGTGFQTDGDVAGGDDVFHHRFLLVDLDRIEGGVAALVVEALDVAIEGTGQVAHLALENVGETHQQRQRQPRFAQLADQHMEVDRLAVRAVGADFDVAGIADGEVAGTPVANTIDAAAVRHGPLAAVIFARASWGHSRESPVGNLALDGPPPWAVSCTRRLEGLA